MSIKSLYYIKYHFILILLAMFSKHKRLTGKDIQFMTRKRQYIPGWIFGFFYVRQYPNRKYNQISSHISLKLDKRAVRRRIIKRTILANLKIKDILNNEISWQYQKIFITLNKNKLEPMQKFIQNNDTKNLKKYINTEFDYAWSTLIKKIGHAKR